MNTDELETKGGEKPITDPGEIKTRLDEMGEKLSETMALAKSAPDGEAINTEIKSLKETIEAIKGTVADLPTADHSAQIKAIADQVDAFQTGAALGTIGKPNVSEGMKSIVARVMDSEIYKSIHDANGNKSGQIAANGSWSPRTEIPSFAAAGYKAPSPVVISDMAGSDTEVRRPTTVEAREWSMDIVSRIPSVITANAATYTVPRETDPSRRGAWKTTLAANIDGDPTPKSTATMTDTEGCMIGSTHRFYNASDVLLGTAVVVSFDSGTDVVTYVTNSLDFDATSGWKVTSENYAAIAELGEKPNGFVGTTSD